MQEPRDNRPRVHRIACEHMTPVVGHRQQFIPHAVGLRVFEMPCRVQSRALGVEGRSLRFASPERFQKAGKRLSCRNRVD
jgi:hypothetical protein